MRRIMLMAGLIGSLVACGGSAGNVTSPGAAGAARRAGAAPVLPVSLREPDPDVRRGLKPEFTRVNCAVAKCVALTFDDGPAQETELLLRILDRHGVRATFFVVGGMVQENPEILRKEVMAGHEIGNHSWSHVDLAALSAEAAHRELARTQEIVKAHTGREMTLMRPPYGSTSERVASVTAKLGLAQVMWAVDPLDWKDRSAGLVRRRVLSQTGNGDIVLLHDIHMSSIEAVPSILKDLAGRGYRFVTVSELLAGTPVVPGREYRERAAT